MSRVCWVVLGETKLCRTKISITAFGVKARVKVEKPMEGFLMYLNKMA